jgi:large subunit ribosomal protein L21
MIAIIETGGKQYKVSKGDKIKVEKLDVAAGKNVKFDVLLAGDEKGVEIGTPTLKTTVEGKVLRQDRSVKVTGIKHKPKKRQLKRYGHRQAFTEVEITKIG